MYTSTWFLGLVTVLALLLGNTIRRQALMLIKKKKKGCRPWGSFFFHVGLFIVILAALHTMAFQKRAFLHLIENEPYYGDSLSLQGQELGFLAQEFTPGIKLNLDEFITSRGKDGQLKEIKSRLTVSDNHHAEQITLQTNQTHTVNGITLYQSSKYGYTLSFLFKKKSGAVSKTFLNIGLAKSPKQPVEAHATIPSTPYKIKITLFPDHSRQEFNLQKPSAFLVVSKNGQEIYNGLTFPKQTVDLPEGEKLGFDEVQYWSGIRLVNDRGAMIAFTGFWLAALGLVLLYCVPSQKVPAV